jgi:hypothetical protein
MFGFNGNGTLTGNLVGWWPLEEGYGNTAYDLSSQNNKGVFNSPSWSPLWTPLTNQTNLAVANFNGVSGGGGYTAVPLTSQLEPSKVTVSLWFMEPSYGSVTYPQVGLVASGFTQGYTFLLPASGDHNAGMIIGSGSECWVHSMPTIGTWVHAVGTFDGNNIIVYFNGAPVSTGTCGPISYSGVSSPYVFYIPSGDTVYLSNVQIYSTPLTAAQVSQLYREGIAGSPLENAGLVGWWPLAYTPNDYSGNGNNGVPTNAVYSNVGYSAPVNAIQVANFNGMTSNIVFGSSSNLETNSYTWAFWFDPSVWNAGNAGVFGQSNNAGSPYMIQQGTSSAPMLQFSNSGGSAGYAVYTPVSINQWQFITGTYAYSTGILTIYLNGQLAPYISSSYPSSATATPIARYSAPIYINNPYWVIGTTGSFADIQIYNTVLTSQQVQQLYLQGLPLYNKLNVSFG